MAESATSPQSRSSAPPPSLWGWISLLSKATGITITVFLHALKTLARPPKNDRTTRQQIAYTGIRIYQSSLPATSIQNLRPSTTTTCKKFAKKHHDALKVVVVFYRGGYLKLEIRVRVRPKSPRRSIRFRD
ncbi:hypothetical protein BGZ57DRAFT_119972 [Hyaloscypha finlandica]|nr:hypothetical protein BGZ57DRAFT_119972 [Hyaloscypha finlandica]